jgi:hypothetical protein
MNDLIHAVPDKLIEKPILFTEAELLQKSKLELVQQVLELQELTTKAIDAVNSVQELFTLIEARIDD